MLKDIEDLPKETIAKIASLVAGVKDTKEKARIIYEFMQNKTRYISVQVGIGGWKPTPAKEVDKLGYGDCKALTNYTKALLKSQGIDSYYTIVDSGSSGLDIDEEFVEVGSYTENSLKFLEAGSLVKFIAPDGKYFDRDNNLVTGSATEKNSKEYRCGIIATEALVKKINKNKVRCRVQDRLDRYKRYIGVCFVEEINLNQWMVRNGHAVAYRRYSKDYIKDEDYAKKNKLGLWSGDFINPEKWRKLN